MFDGGGGLIADMMRARILTKLVQAKPWRRVLVLVADLLILVGGWLKTRFQPPPAAPSELELRDQRV